MSSTLKTIDRRLARLEDFLIMVMMATLALLIGLGVVLRYVFNNPLTWSEEIVVTVFVWMVMLGVPSALRSKMHIRIDVLILRLSNSAELDSLRIKTSIRMCIFDRKADGTPNMTIQTKTVTTISSDQVSGLLNTYRSTTPNPISNARVAIITMMRKSSKRARRRSMVLSVDDIQIIFRHACDQFLYGLASSALCPNAPPSVNILASSWQRMHPDQGYQ